MIKLGLELNKDYSGQGVQVKHKTYGWFELIRTTTKMLMYKGKDGKECRMRTDSLMDVKLNEVMEKVDNIHKECDNEVSEYSGGMEDDWSVESPYFGNDFAMASDPDIVFDNDTMYC